MQKQKAPDPYFEDSGVFALNPRTACREFLRGNLLIVRSDPGDDLDPSLVHRLEPFSLLLGVLVWDGADGVAALALAVGVSTITCGC